MDTTQLDLRRRARALLRAATQQQYWFSRSGTGAYLGGSVKLFVLAATVGLLAQTPPTQKWVGPMITMPGGGTAQTTLYYGPWQCRTAWLTDCNTRCGGLPSRGCIWLADLKTDVKTRFLFMPISWGGKLAITHCCCDWPENRPTKPVRDEWDAARKKFRNDWAKDFGAWPTDDGLAWAGHHIRDLLHGGSPTSPDNVLPAPKSAHALYDRAYRECYSPDNRWSRPGPDYPYAE